MKRIILHLDFDSFFASVEQQDNPQFRNKPLGVTASNGRTAIIAASREAKKKGVKSVCRTYEARQLCPDLLLTRANFNRYWEVSKVFIKICNDYSPYIEVFSLDELFMDVTHSAHLFGGPYEIIRRIKERIAHEIGEYVTVSVGVSHNRLLAKLASGWKKPNGVFEIRKDDIEEVYKQAELTDICGIGERLEKRLHAMGIFDLLKLRNTPLPFLIAEFGNVQGQALKNIGLGEDMSPVRPFTQAPDVKSVGRNYCLPRNEYDKRLVLQNMYELWEEVAIKLRKLHKRARTIGFGLRGTYNQYGRKTFHNYFNNGRDLYQASLYMLKENCHPELFGYSKRNEESQGKLRKGSGFFGVKPQNDNILADGYVRQIGVWASNLVDANTIPASLFEKSIDNPKLQGAIDAINDKFGDHTIRYGFLLKAPKLTTVPNGFMGDRLQRTQLAKETEYEDEIGITRAPFHY